MRVLLISHGFPPDPEVGALRSAKVSEALAAAGHQVDVVTARLPGETQAIRLTSRGMTVHTVRTIPHPRNAYLRAKRWLGGNGGAPSSGAEDSRGPEAAWKRYLLSLFWLPDEFLGFIPAALWQCWRIYRQGGGADLLYTTAPPFSAHLAGLLLKWTTGIRWAAEFRDPWTDNPAKPARLRTRFTDAIERRLERLCLRSADHVVSASDAIHELLQRKTTPRVGQHFVVARNGIDRLLSLAPAPEPRSSDLARPFRIVHAGSLYHGRDPRPFLRAVAALWRRGRFAEGDVQVEFVGNNRWFDDVSVERFAQDLGIGSMVRFWDWLPHRACLEMVERADLLLLLAQRQPAQVPNKLFEYLGTRKPILAFVDAEGEGARMLQRAGGHYLVVEDSVPAAEAALEQALTEKNRHSDESVLREWTTERQMGRLLTALQA